MTVGPQMVKWSDQFGSAASDARPWQTFAVKDNTVIHAAGHPLEHEPVPPGQSIAGNPTTAATAIGDFGGLEVGIWEMSPGVMSDVEAAELFIVLSGYATVAFTDGTPDMVLGPGDVVRFGAGTETVWTVTETLRKIYLT
jgi:uncharacterized cupin superfamily protein